MEEKSLARLKMTNEKLFFCRYCDRKDAHQIINFGKMC